MDVDEGDHESIEKTNDDKIEPETHENNDREKLTKVDEDGDKASSEGTTLHVANLTRNVESKHLHEIFNTYGSVKTVDLQVDKRVGLSKGNAHIEFENAKDAEEALIHMDGGQIDGNVIRVSILLVNKRRRESPDDRDDIRNSRRSPSPRRAPARAQESSRTSDIPNRASRASGPYSAAPAASSSYAGKYGPASGPIRRNSPPRDRDRDFRGGRGRGPPARRPSPVRSRGLSPQRRRDSRERDLPPRRRSRSPARVRARSPPPPRRSPLRRRRSPSPAPRRRRSPSSSPSSRSDSSSSSSDSSRSRSSSSSRSRSRSRGRN